VTTIRGSASSRRSPDTGQDDDALRVEAACAGDEPVGAESVLVLGDGAVVAEGFGVGFDGADALAFARLVGNEAVSAIASGTGGFGEFIGVTRLPVPGARFSARPDVCLLAHTFRRQAGNSAFPGNS
jgi:hypothetical protein